MPKAAKTYHPQSQTQRQRFAVAAIIFLSSAVVCGSMALIALPVPADTADQPANTITDDVSSQQDSTASLAAADEGGAIGEYRALSQSTSSERADNISLAAAAIDGAIIEPNASFSFNDTVGDVAADEHYQDAPAIIGNSLQNAHGGGISQVSSALYVAALSAGMIIDERHAHTAVVDYVPLGLDATLTSNDWDLRITNPYDEPVRIAAIAEGQAVTVRIIGPPLVEGRVIEPGSKIDEYHPADEVRDEQAAGSEGQEDYLRGKEYYVVSSYRLYYQDGVLTDTETLAKDTYVVLTGTDTAGGATEGGGNPI
jgi:vancomycin resistance protein YoaR